MSQTLLEKHEKLVVEIAAKYLDNMEVELGKKFNDREHQVNARLSEFQQASLKDQFNISSNEFLELYSRFNNMQPTDHFNQVMEAFTRSGGGVEVEPEYEEETKRLYVHIHFVIKDNKLEKIEGLTPIEDAFMKMNAMLQVESVLKDAEPGSLPF